MNVAIDRLDPSLFAKRIADLIDVYAYLRAQSADYRSTFDPLKPPRGEIPRLSNEILANEKNEAAALDAIFAFAISAILRNRGDLISPLELELLSRYGGVFPGARFFARWRGETRLESGDETVAGILRQMQEGDHLQPLMVWLAGLRLFERITQSSFKEELMPLLAEWLRTNWKRIVVDERFRLADPTSNVPPIEAVLTRTKNDRGFVASLLLSADDAIGSRLSDEYRELLARDADIKCAPKEEQQDDPSMERRHA